MTNEQVLARLSELATTGRQLTHIRPVNIVDFHQWRTSSMSLLRAAYGENSDQYRSFVYGCNAPMFVQIGLGILKGAQDDIEAGVGSASPSGLTIGIEDLPLHKRIADVSVGLYRDGHYPNAVQDASKALINLVKERSGRHDLDGPDLMRQVFSANHPILGFNDLLDQSDRDEQEGINHLFEGVALGIRNPRAHDFLQDSPGRALQYISLIGLLADLADEAHRT